MEAALDASPSPEQPGAPEARPPGGERQTHDQRASRAAQSPVPQTRDSMCELSIPPQAGRVSGIPRPPPRHRTSQVCPRDFGRFGRPSRNARGLDVDFFTAGNRRTTHPGNRGRPVDNARTVDVRKSGPSDRNVANQSSRNRTDQPRRRRCAVMVRHAAGDGILVGVLAEFSRGPGTFRRRMQADSSTTIETGGAVASTRPATSDQDQPDVDSDISQVGRPRPDEHALARDQGTSLPRCVPAARTGTPAPAPPPVVVQRQRRFDSSVEGIVSILYKPVHRAMNRTRWRKSESSHELVVIAGAVEVVLDGRLTQQSPRAIAHRVGGGLGSS